jgi:spore germination cell wall hydrolase CwlJ-like protein
MLFSLALSMLMLCLPVTAGASEEVQSVRYTSTEQEMLGYIVQQEAGGLSLQHKQVIARVVLNRVQSKDFPDTIAAVLTQKNQFSSLSNWYSKKNRPDADTLQAVESVLNGSYEDQTMGATFFYAPRWAGKSAASWFENHLRYLFTLDGHRFFTTR